MARQSLLVVAPGSAAVTAEAAMREALSDHPFIVAPRLLGATLRCGGVALTLTEVEAYGGVGEDPGSHAFRRLSGRNQSMFGPPGRAYVYFTYGMHWCLNVVAHEPGQAGAVLLRAGRITSGIATARARRPAARTDRDLARGPARLASALAVDRTHDGMDLLDPGSPIRLRLPASDAGPGGTRTGPRTGVAGAGATLDWRFWIADEPTVSPSRPG